MIVLYILLPLALVLAGVFVGVFVWAVRNGQFDDLETPGHRVLFDDTTMASDDVSPESATGNSAGDQPAAGEDRGRQNTV